MSARRRSETKPNLDWAPGATLAERLRFQAAACGRIGSSLYADLLARAAADLKADGPTAEVLRGHEDDPGPSALALRLLGAVNRLVLRGDAPRLAAAYADPQRDPEPTWREFRDVVERNAGELRRLVDLPVQTNEVGRSAALLPGFLTVAAETGMPLRLLEVGASAGLNLRWDRYRYQAGELSWGPPDSPVRIEVELRGGEPPAAEVEIVERRGCDAAPVDPLTPEGRQTLLAYVWPDQRERVERAKGALAIAAELPLHVERAEAATWTERTLAERVPSVATVLYHSIVMQYLTAEELSAFERIVRKAGARATPEEPLAWLRMEPAGERAEVKLTLWPGGEDRLMARAGYHGSPVVLLA